MAPQLIFGTATFGMDKTDFQDEAAVSSLLQTLSGLNVKRLDSGARYPPLKPGRAEELIGEAGALSHSLTIDTKVYTDARKDGGGDLSREAVQASLAASLQRMRLDKVNVLHVHRSDPSTPLEEQIRAFNEQIHAGRCKAWGVSNTTPEVLENILSICDETGLLKPSCYQGDYNVITRGMEKKLLPMLRAHGMTFNAFRPLAAGFLNGKFIRNEHAGTRFDAEKNPLGGAAQKLFGADDLLVSMKKFDAEVASYELTPLEVAVRWIVYHSALTDNDGVILGASKASQIEETVSLVRKGPLDKDVVEIAERLWKEVEKTRKDII